MYKLSRLAVEDFTGIYEYTLQNFGVAQADAYTELLENALLLLADSPRIGYECPEIGEGVRRYDHQHHVIFYRLRVRDIFVIRILRQQMNPNRHNFEP